MARFGRDIVGPRFESVLHGGGEHLRPARPRAKITSVADVLYCVRAVRTLTVPYLLSPSHFNILRTLFQLEGK